MLHYIVRCRFEGDPSVADRWIAWLNDGHLQAVCDAGAMDARIFRTEAEVPSYAVVYRFESRVDYERYLRDAAPALREEGLSRFPLSLGLKYDREIWEPLTD